jgi:hypothetical protein
LLDSYSSPDDLGETIVLEGENDNSIMVKVHQLSATAGGAIIKQ